MNFWIVIYKEDDLLKLSILHKNRGNEYFKIQKYEKAIDEYAKAIVDYSNAKSIIIIRSLIPKKPLSLLTKHYVINF